MMASRDQPQEPTDPDVDLSVSAHRWELARGPFSAVAAVSVGGGLGAAARYGVSLLWPTPPGAFPWVTLTINVLGCAMIGVLLVLVSDVWSAHRLVRPFFGTGVLGGFTTFSAYAVDVQHLVQVGRVGTGLSYLALTLLVALAAVWTAATTTRRLITSAFGRSCRSGRSW